jgi:hypothetical protein
MEDETTDNSQTTPPLDKSPVDKPAQSPEPTKPRKKTPAVESVNEPWPNMDRASTGATLPPRTDKEKRAHGRAKVDKIVKVRPTNAKVKVNGNVYKISNVHNEGDILCCVVEGPGITDNDFRFVNPPIMVPDGTTTKRHGIGGEPFDAPNFKEDPRAALLQIVKDAIETIV